MPNARWVATAALAAVMCSTGCASDPTPLQTGVAAAVREALARSVEDASTGQGSKWRQSPSSPAARDPLADSLTRLFDPGWPFATGLEEPAGGAICTTADGAPYEAESC